MLRIDVGEAETKAFGTDFLFSLKARALAGMHLLCQTSTRAAVASHLPGE